MLEMIKTQDLAQQLNQISQPGCEVSRFMKNFSQAAHEGNPEEIASYFADDMEAFEFPLDAEWTDETILVDDHVATFSCSLRQGANVEQRLTCVLDKSEGYWQIIHGEVCNENHKH